MDFKEMYDKSKVWADMDRAVEELQPNEIKALASALKLVKKMTGLDMRQDFLLGVLNAQIKYQIA